MRARNRQAPLLVLAFVCVLNHGSRAKPVGYSHRRSLYCYRASYRFSALEFRKIGTVHDSEMAPWRWQLAFCDGKVRHRRNRVHRNRLGASHQYTDFPGLHYGKTTLAEIKGKLGNDNFAWDGEHMPDTSLVMKNSYRVNYKDVIITLVTELAKETVPDIPKKI